jgi:HD-like signal output (HDOD) protein
MMPHLRDVSALASTLARVRPFPGVVDKVRRLAADPSVGLGEIARLVEGDVGVSTDLLRVANAPTSALAQRCMSVKHAATLLGVRRVASLVASAAALTYVEDASSAYPQIAAHVLAVAGVARVLAPITGVSPEDAFTAGLLHDIGVLLLAQSDDPFYTGLLDTGGFAEEPNLDDERALMGLDHASLGGAVAREWHLPSPLPEVIELHHDWHGAVQAGGAVCAMVALVRVADALVPMLRETPEPLLDDLTPLFHEPAFEHLGLTREELFRLWEGLRRACDKANVVGSLSSAPALDLPIPQKAKPHTAFPLRVILSEPASRNVVLPVVAAAAVLLVGVVGVLLLS